MDGGPEFTASATCQFLKDWEVHHHLLSAAHPNSNCKAEIGIKTVKQLITNNTDPRANLNTDALQRAVLQYWNTPDPTTKIVTCSVCIWQTYQGLYTHTSQQLYTSPHLE